MKNFLGHWREYSDQAESETGFRIVTFRRRIGAVQYLDGRNPEVAAVGRQQTRCGGGKQPEGLGSVLGELPPQSN